MKTFFTLSFALFSFWANATNYYLSNTGNDSNAGTSTALAWATINKLNTYINFHPLLAGDTVFFKCGDTFRGRVNVNQAGSSTAPIVYTAYGTGNNPIISGAQTLTGWTDTGSSVYTISTTLGLSNFFANDHEQTLARYPNEGNYLSLDSATNHYLKDASLSSVASNKITGSRMCVHSAQWLWEKSLITSYDNATNKIIFTTPTEVSPIASYGYFLYDNINLLDSLTEWHYNATSDILTFKSATNPNSLNCEVTIYTAGLQLAAAAQYIVISNITFEKQFQAGVVFNESNQYITISDCKFYRQYNYGVELKGRFNKVTNSYFREVDGFGLRKNSGARDTISYNTFRNIGQFRNSGVSSQQNLSAIAIDGDSSYIHHNNIDSTGYCGITAGGNFHLIERNILSHCMLVNNDGAALKSFGIFSTNITYRNNFVSFSDGNTEGTFRGDFLTPAIYFDYDVNHCTIHENTVYNHTSKGIFQNSGTNHNTITDNVIYRSNFCLDLNGNIVQNVPLSDVIVKHNAFFAYDNNSYVVQQRDYTGIFNAGTLDSNYYFQPYNSARYVSRPAPPIATFDFAQWQATGNDTHTKSSFVSWNYPTNNSQLFMNQTDNDLVVSLGTTTYIDLDNIVLIGSITLRPYTSKILIIIPCGTSINLTSVDNINTGISTSAVENRATQSITAVNKIGTLSVGAGKYYAGQFILLNPGFEVKSGSYFIGKILENPCNGD